MSHTPTVVSPHRSRSSRKSSSQSVRPKHSRSPPKNFHSQSGSFSPVETKKESRVTKKHSDSDSPGSLSKRKRSTKSPVKQFNPKLKLSETSLFAELVKDRQMRELAMKRLTQTSTKTTDVIEIVEIHDDSENEQENTKIDVLDTKLNKNNLSDDVDSCMIVDMSENNIQSSMDSNSVDETLTMIKPLPEVLPKMSVEKLQSPSVSKVEFIENGVEHSLESTSSLTPKLISPDKNSPDIIENKTLSKLPLPPVLPLQNQLSPDSEIKSSKKSIKDLPLPPGRFFKKNVC